MSGNERPTMKKVVEQLQKALDNQLAPSGPWSDDDDFAAHHQGKPAGSLASSASISPSWMLDVFISFRGEDICKTFVDNLYWALVRRQLITYKDDGELPREEEIKSTSLIKESRIAIIIFSPKYASSSGCLKELAFIMKNRDARGQIVIPIFYGVEPSEVRSQTRYYGEAIAMHELNNSNKTVASWREALVKAADLSGSWDLANGNESELVQKMAGRISNELHSLMQHSEAKSKPSADTDLIGIEARMQELNLLLEVGTGGVRRVGISGMWGSGKSTLASSIYSVMSHEFEGCCFVNKVRARSRTHGLKMLQEEVLSNVLKLKVTLTNLEEGIYMMKRKLCKNSILIVLDDVDHADHLEMLAGSDNWFGNGSRIIFTTRKPGLVKARSSLTLNIRMLDVKEAIELFSRRAFGKGFEEVSLNMVSKFDGHPSALIRLGSFLYGKDMSEWMSILGRLEAIPVNEILSKFKIRDDGVVRDISDRLIT
ncbi:putative TIR domain, P-loop containing nucleoside triphosphate hydrolase [Helianthus debilis subsp. tardiflorus]